MAGETVSRKAAQSLGICWGKGRRWSSGRNYGEVKEMGQWRPLPGQEQMVQVPKTSTASSCPAISIRDGSRAGVKTKQNNKNHATRRERKAVLKNLNPPGLRLIGSLTKVRDFVLFPF